MSPEEEFGPELLSLLRSARAASCRSEAAPRERCGAVAETADGARYPGASRRPQDGTALDACAERVAVWAARAGTAAPVVRLALWAATGAGSHPCGSCLQVLRELAPGAALVMQRGDAPPRRLQPAGLLPDAFVSFEPVSPPPPAQEGPAP